MNCEQVARAEMAEKYLRDGLSEAERDAFEQHFLECAHCFEELKALRALHAALRHSESAVRNEEVAAPTIWNQRWTWMAAAAAVVVAVVVLGWWFGPSRSGVDTGPPVIATPPTTQPMPGAGTDSILKELSRVEAPSYEPIALRGDTDAATQRYQDAMQLYSKGEYAKAIPGLEAAARMNAKNPGAPFFLGICLLLTDENELAIQALERTIALDEASYLEEAHFYLAKARIRTNDLPAAKAELQKTIGLQGKLRDEAQRILRELENLTKSPR
jgi:tetratricopeptide (TPR) repeat protein